MRYGGMQVGIKPRSAEGMSKRRSILRRKVSGSAGAVGRGSAYAHTVHAQEGQVAQLLIIQNECPDQTPTWGIGGEELGNGTMGAGAKVCVQCVGPVGVGVVAGCRAGRQ